jgi:hypothetical protein
MAISSHATAGNNINARRDSSTVHLTKDSGWCHGHAHAHTITPQPHEKVVGQTERRQTRDREEAEDSDDYMGLVYRPVVHDAQSIQRLTWICTFAQEREISVNAFHMNTHRVVTADTQLLTLVCLSHKHPLCQANVASLRFTRMPSSYNLDGHIGHLPPSWPCLSAGSIPGGAPQNTDGIDVRAAPEQSTHILQYRPEIAIKQLYPPCAGVCC